MTSVGGWSISRVGEPIQFKGSFTYTTDNTGGVGDYRWYAPQLSWGSGDSTCKIIYDFTKEDREMSRGLWWVFVVDPEEGEVIYQAPMVADNEENARFKVASHAIKVHAEHGGEEYDIDDLDVLVLRVGSVRAKTEIPTVRLEE